jgi:hypothetical protein
MSQTEPEVSCSNNCNGCNIESERMPQKTRDKHIRQVTAVAGIKPWKAEVTSCRIRNIKVLTIYFPFDTMETALGIHQKLRSAGLYPSRYKPLW